MSCQWDVKELTHSSSRVGHVVPGVVVYLTFTLMYRGIITHSFITCKLHLSSLAKCPSQCC